MDAEPSSSFTMPGRALLGELLAYTGGALALVGAATSPAQSTSQVGGRTVLLAVIGVALLAVGQIVGDTDDPRRRRIRSVFWLLGHSALIQAVSLLISNQFSVQGRAAIISVGLMGVALGGYLWLRHRSSLQQIVLFSSLLVVVEGLSFPQTDTFGYTPPSFDLMAFALIVLGVAWLILALKGAITPRRTGLVLGSLSIVIGPIFLSVWGGGTSGFLLMAIAAAVVVAVGEGIDDLAMVGIGIVGLIFGSASGWAALIKTSTPGSIGALVAGLVVVAIGAVFLRGSTPPTAPMAPTAPTPPMPPLADPPLPGGEPQG